MSANTVKCPNCAHEFNVEAALSSVIEKSIRTKYLDALNKEKETMARQKEELDKLRVNQENIIRQQIEQARLVMKEELKKEAGAEIEMKMKMLQNEAEERSVKIKEMQTREVEMLKEKNLLQQEKEEMKLRMEKEMLEKQQEIIAKAKQQEKEQNDLRIRELEQKLQQQIELAEAMKKKAEQGSMQLQGEVLEMALEDLLRSSFPFDLIEEVGKGVKGADCIQTVRNSIGQTCGKIIYESKRTKAFSNEWIEKLKRDLRAQQADIAILVTETMPKDMEFFGQKEGIWVCSFSEVRGLSTVLRESLLKVYAALLSQENRGDKMQLLYDYLTGNEFRQQIEAIMEGFVSLKQGIIKEKIQMEKMWKEREKQLDKVLLNATHFYGSVKGIAGSSVPDIKLLEGETDEEDD